MLFLITSIFPFISVVIIYFDIHISDDGTHFWSLNGNKKYSKSDMYHMLEPYYIIENRLNSNIQQLEVNSNYHIL